MLSEDITESAFSVLRDILESASETLRQTRYLPDPLRTRILLNSSRNTTAMIDLVRLLVAASPPTAVERPPSLLNPNATNFYFPVTIDLTNMEDVPIVPSDAVIEATLVPQEDQESVDLCTVCQESMGEHCSMLRNCHHMFHERCIRQWFSTNPRCPVCRNDIREESETV